MSAERSSTERMLDSRIRVETARSVCRRARGLVQPYGAGRRNCVVNYRLLTIGERETERLGASLLRCCL